MKSILSFALISLVILTPLSGEAAEFVDPPVIHAGPSGIKIRAHNATETLPGLGPVSGLYVYDITTGATATVQPTAGHAGVPPVIEAARGGALKIEFQNDLKTHDALGADHPAASNLHSHGLIVSPQGLGFGGPNQSYGDCVFLLSQAQGGMPPAGIPAGDPCSEAADRPEMNQDGKRVRYSYTLASDHPSGLFWVHPHPHGDSEGQISNGLGTLLSIGSLWDYSYIDCQVSAASGPETCKTQAEQQAEIAKEASASAPGGSVKIRYLALKDLQVTSAQAGKPPYSLIEFPRRPAPQDPQHPTKSEADEIDKFQTANDKRKRLCEPVILSGSKADDLIYANPPIKDAADFRHGQCWKQASPNDRWLFTVSGQVYPHITIKADQLEVWRVANTSADVTYRLALETTDEPVARPLAFHVRAVDGVPIGSEKPIEEFTLMPSARIEVVLARCGAFGASDGHCVAPGAHVTARWRTKGVATGVISPPKDNPDGDRWPPIDLATVEFEGAGQNYSARLNAVRPAYVTAAQSKATLAAAAPDAAPTPSGALKAAAPTSPVCDWTAYKADAQVFSPQSDLVRLVRLNNNDFGGTDGEMFGVHVENHHLTDEAGNPVAVQKLLDDGRQAPQPGTPSLIARLSLADPCDAARLLPDGFAKFYPKFTMQPKSNVSAYYGGEEYWLAVNDSRECHNFHIHQMKFSVVDADVVVDPADGKSTDQCLGDRQLMPPIAQNALHDNFPLPPGARVLLRIRFDGPKLGRFVFHCHILEHEDKGMMSSIDVILPPNPASAPRQTGETGWLKRIFAAASAAQSYLAPAGPGVADAGALIDGKICSTSPANYSARR